MPPKSKFTKEEIIAAALEIASQEGISYVTARAIGIKLNSSSRPIFTVFKSMDEVIQEVKKAARLLYNTYIKEGLKEEISFRGVGRQYIKFSVEQPKLFQLLFMSEEPEGTTLNSLPLFDDNYDDIVLSITKQYGLHNEDALTLYKHLWVYTHGIASMCATKTLVFSVDEMNKMITEIFISLITKIKSDISQRERNTEND